MLFHKTKQLVKKIDHFVDLTAQVGLHFKSAITSYIQDEIDDFESRLIKISSIENQADILTRDIESQLYQQTLIPDARGDVLGILESMDSIIDAIKATVTEFSIEQPEIPNEIIEDVLILIENVTATIDSVTAAVRTYFYDVYAIKDNINKVKFFEKESDIIAEKIKRNIFNMNVDLAKKMHIRTFIRHIDSPADIAEEVADRLSIAAIKRIV